MRDKLMILSETGRLLVRAPQTADMEAIVTLWSDPAAMQYTGGPRQRKIVVEHFRAYAADPAAFVAREHECWWSVLLRASGEWLGLVALIQKTAGEQTIHDLGYFFLPAHWGQGYATEATRPVVEFALGDLGLNSVEAVIDPENGASQAVARKLGLTESFREPRSDGVERQVWRLERQR